MNIKRALTVFLCLLLSAAPLWGNEGSGSTETVMCLDKKIGQMLMVGVPGKTINKTMKDLITSCHPGGFIFFSYNCGSEKQIRTLTSDLQDYSVHSGGLPLFISIDQEGGRVVRITSGVTRFPGNMAFGSANDPVLVRHAARITAVQLRLLGVNMNLAPDVDVNNNPDNPIINTRAFGSDPDHVSRLGKAYIRGLQNGGCLAVAKHFPGHGDTRNDSHKTLPEIPYDRQRLDRVELLPFKSAVEVGCAGIMSAHIRYPKIESRPVPATLSSIFLTDILRNEMNFDGLVMTDDLEMGAIGGNMKIGDAAVEAVKAGADIILVTTHRNTGAIHSALLEAVRKGEIPSERINASVNRILRHKAVYGIYDPAAPGKVLSYRLSSHNSRLLTAASRLNRIVSERALYFRRGDLDVPIRGWERVVPVPRSRTFKRELDSAGMGYVTPNRMLSMDIPDTEHVYFVYECTDENASEIENLVPKMPANSTLVIASTDNPFLVSKYGGANPVLFTFSNTPLSYRALIRAIQGELEVQTDTVIELGFNRNG